MNHSPEWYKSRLGKVTGSRVFDATTHRKTKDGSRGEELVARASYREQIVAERLTGFSHSPDLSHVEAVQWGRVTESDAINMYSFMNDCIVDAAESTDHPRIAMTCATPDGLLQNGGVLEAKCPKTTTHIGYLKAGIVPEKYKKQMMWEMACTERSWGDFISFDPRIQCNLQLFVVRFEPKPSEITDLEDQVEEFLHEVDAEVQLLLNRK